MFGLNLIEGDFELNLGYRIHEFLGRLKKDADSNTTVTPARIHFAVAGERMAWIIAGVVERRGTSSNFRIARFSKISNTPALTPQMAAVIPAARRYPPSRLARAASV